MRFNASSEWCSSDVVLAPLEPRGAARWAAGVAVCGAALALGCVALLLAGLRKRRIRVTAPCVLCSRRVQECEQRSDSDSSAAPDSAEGHEPQRILSSDVAAFALKARVVYPINQRYRPLADGASNPSLQEPKHPAPPSLDSASSLADDWPSQDRDDDDSSQFVSCGPSSKTHVSHVFRRVQHYPQTPCHSRLSLLSLTLQELQMHTAQLQQHKYRMFLQVVRVLLGESASAGLVQEQQQGVELLLKGVSVAEGVESGAESESETHSLEEVEKTGREQLERSLQTAVSFAQQLCRLGQDRRVSDAVMRAVLGAVCALEEPLAELQAALLKMLLDRFLCWQEVSDCLREKTALLQREAELLLRDTGQSVAPLRADGQQQALRALETQVQDALQENADEVRRATEDLVRSRCLKACARRRRMMKNQSAESSRVTHSQTDARLMTKASAELFVSHWHQRREFDLQQDSRIIEALCERWTVLFSMCSRRVADLCREFVLDHITAGPAPSMGPTPSTDPAPSTGPAPSAHTGLQQQRRARSAGGGSLAQEWTEDEDETRLCLCHFAEQQRQIATATVARHSHMQISPALIEEQQQLLILEVQTILAARGFYLRCVREMKLTVQSDIQTVGVEQWAELEAAAELLQGHAHFLCGHALVHRARPQAHRSTERHAQERLLEAVCESVYVTRDSVSSLIGEYRSRIRSRTTPGSSQRMDTDTHKQTMACATALQTELSNWARKPTSTAAQHRVVELKRKCVMEIQKDHQSAAHTHYRQLRDEERSFLCRLASLARVSPHSLDTDDPTGCGDGLESRWRSSDEASRLVCEGVFSVSVSRREEEAPVHTSRPSRNTRVFGRRLRSSAAAALTQGQLLSL